MFAIELQIGKAEKKVSSCEIDHCTIGKAPDNLIVLRDWTVEKRHATIYKRASQLFIEDHGTMSGTVVNGKAVTGEYGPLVDTDRITIGDNSLRVFLGDMASAIDSTASANVAVVIPPASIAVSPGAAEQKSATAPDRQTVNGVQTKLTKTTEARRLLHSRLIGLMDLRRLEVSLMSEDNLRDVTKFMIDDVIKQAKFSDPEIDLKNLARDLLNEVVGLGPLEDLLADSDISQSW